MSGAKLDKGLIASGTRVRDGFFWRGVQGDGITVELIDAQVGTLHDQPGSWDPVKELHLSSFRYDRIESNMDVQERLSWLAKHDATVSRFTPAPYVQLANVLRRQGMISAVNRVMIKREDLQRDADMKQAVDGNEWYGLFALVLLPRPLLSLPFKWMFGYGHQPVRVLPWIAIIWLVTVWFAEQTHRRGQFVPTSAVVLNSPELLRSFPSTPSPPTRRSGGRNWMLGSRPNPGATMKALAHGSMRWICLSRWMLWGRRKIGPPQHPAAHGANGVTGCAGWCKWPAG